MHLNRAVLKLHIVQTFQSSDSSLDFVVTKMC
jgi:hypothetical protein